jgi:cytochrome P450
MTPYIFNEFQTGYADDPYPELARLRAEGPVNRHPIGRFVLSHYRHISALLRAPLSVDENSVRGTMAEFRAAIYRGRQPRAGGRSMFDQDPPDHTRLRGLVSQAFTPRAVARLEPVIIELVRELLDTMSGSADLIESLAFPLPSAVITRMMGLPAGEDQLRLRDLTGRLVRSLEPVVDPELAATIMSADDELVGLAHEQIAWKRAHPDDDLLTALIQAEDNGDVLDDDELAAQLLLLHIAGHETTVNLIGNGAHALLRHPDQLARLRSEPALAGNAIEELLRFDAPAQFARRITLAPYDVEGCTIPAGAFVLAVLSSGNRDESYWGPDADVLRLDRVNARSHLSFGAGVHHCLGASLARLEGRIALRELAVRFPRLALEDDVEWNGRVNLRGPRRLRVHIG